MILPRSMASVVLTTSIPYGKTYRKNWALAADTGEDSGTSAGAGRLGSFTSVPETANTIHD